MAALAQSLMAITQGAVLHLRVAMVGTWYIPSNGIIAFHLQRLSSVPMSSFSDGLCYFQVLNARLLQRPTF